MSEVLREDAEQARHGFEVLAELFAVSLVFTEATGDPTGYEDPYGRALHGVVVEGLAAARSEAEHLATQLRLRHLGLVQGPGGHFQCWTGWLPQVSRQTPAAVRLYAPDASLGSADIHGVDNPTPDPDVRPVQDAYSAQVRDIPGRWVQPRPGSSRLSATWPWRARKARRSGASVATAAEKAGTASAAEPRLRDAIRTVLQIVDRAGDDKIARVAVGRQTVSIQPSDLDQGAAIAQELGLTSTADYPMAIPGFTDFSGDVGPLEVHVRGALHPRGGGVS